MYSKNKRLLCAALAAAMVLAMAFAAAPPALAANDAIFIMGNQYDEIKLMQEKLISLGYMEGEANGYFGPETKQAFIAFQKDKGLTADGKAGPSTQMALMGVVYPSKKAAATATPQPAAEQPAATPQQEAAQPEGTGTQEATAQTVAAKTVSLAKTSIFVYGNSFAEVKQIQQKLKDLGYFTASVTGFYGKATEEAVRKFQKAKKLSVDGKCGPATQKALLGTTLTAGGTSSGSSSTPSGSSLGTGGGTSSAKGSVFVYGCSYNEVKEIQQKLKQLGYMTASATGYYGNETLKAVTNFQRAKGLKVDGKCGPATQMALLGKTLTAGKSTANNTNTSNTAPSVSTSQKGAQTVALAKQHLGKPYLWGGNGPASFDCSGFVVYVLKQQGYQSRYRNSYYMSTDTTWKQVAWKDMKAGDMMFFDTRTDGSAPIGHIGIYIGNGQMIHASSGSGKIVIVGITSGYFKDRFRIARRVFY